MDQLPIACTLGASQGNAQMTAWRELDSAYALGRKRTGDEIVLEYAKSDDSITRLESLVAIERKCCAFVLWEAEHSGPRLRLVITGTGDALDAPHIA